MVVKFNSSAPRSPTVWNTQSHQTFSQANGLIKWNGNPFLFVPLPPPRGYTVRSKYSENNDEFPHCLRISANPLGYSR